MKPVPYHPTHNLVTLANSLLYHYNVPNPHPFIPEIVSALSKKKKVICLLFDGMGRAILDHHLSAQSFLKKQKAVPITSTFPSTTAAATNAFLSGRYPNEIGWLGWAHYFKEHDRLIELFTGHDYYTQKPFLDPSIIRRTLHYTPIFEQIQLANPSLNVQYVWPMIREDGAKTLGEWTQKIHHHLKDNQATLLYGYWLDPDKSIHTKGVRHKDITNVIETIDHSIADLAQHHPDTLFLIFADHGLIDTTFLSIREHDDLFTLLQRSFALEPRAAAFYVKPGTHRKFEALFHHYYSRYFHLYSAQEVIDLKLYGQGENHPLMKEFIGDYVAISYSDQSFSHGVPIGDKPLNFLAHHAGMHPDEMSINVLLVNA